VSKSPALVDRETAMRRRRMKPATNWTVERLVFEQKEKKATKKMLFITTAKETVQELIFAVPVGQIEECQASNIGDREGPAKDASSSHVYGGAESRHIMREHVEP